MSNEIIPVATLNLPSRHKVGDDVAYENGVKTVTGVMFTPNKVLYELDDHLLVASEQVEEIA